MRERTNGKGLNKEVNECLKSKPNTFVNLHITKLKFSLSATNTKQLCCKMGHNPFVTILTVLIINETALISIKTICSLNRPWSL